ncbi:MAG: hypothetical protein US60_C0043G0003 [Microgenomates group bacterium GW2011_GWC1_37_8]|uniref:Uncharacterized protein n=1 Tax=Candidatus Woesebacteria bacterium GW2011_GWB1_38_8 TaxID=1618570 RepID=A0A0G0NGF8_9BACT|nr:MAG: hypothetical protein US60_C0043G0003 [Microgenomates group bacterium GW2011_GWC1_37_8]KKQ84989.1 MAG: hypothetical protein UT08_C0011G0007 [Candidatus Woesebacteria bacterium GW2011_GWB1_38_8]
MIVRVNFTEFRSGITYYLGLLRKGAVVEIYNGRTGKEIGTFIDKLAKRHKRVKTL